MQCSRCQGLTVIEEMDGEQVSKCLLCSARVYPPLPTTPERTRCYYCGNANAPGMLSCLACQQKMKTYRDAHPKARKKYGPILPTAVRL